MAGITALERVRRENERLASLLKDVRRQVAEKEERIARLQQREAELRTTRDRQIERARELESMLEAERTETLRWRDQAQAARGQIGILRAMAFPQPPDLKSSVQDDDYGRGW